MKNVDPKWIRPKGNRSTPILAGRIGKLAVIKTGRNRFSVMVRNGFPSALSLTVSQIRKLLKIADQYSSK